MNTSSPRKMQKKCDSLLTVTSIEAKTDFTMKTKLNPSDIYSTDPKRACQLALRRTSHLPENKRLEVINTLLGGHGTEPIRGEWQNGYWCDIVAVYVNLGYTYNLTVMRVRGESQFNSSKFIITSWGDWVERNGEKMGVQ